MYIMYTNAEAIGLHICPKRFHTNLDIPMQRKSDCTPRIYVQSPSIILLHRTIRLSLSRGTFPTKPLPRHILPFLRNRNRFPCPLILHPHLKILRPLRHTQTPPPLLLTTRPPRL